MNKERKRKKGKNGWHSVDEFTWKIVHLNYYRLSFCEIKWNLRSMTNLNIITFNSRHSHKSRHVVCIHFELFATLKMLKMSFFLSHSWKPVWKLGSHEFSLSLCLFVWNDFATILYHFHYFGWRLRFASVCCALVNELNVLYIYERMCSVALFFSIFMCRARIPDTNCTNTYGHCLAPSPSLHYPIGELWKDMTFKFKWVIETDN